jgi:hypothetical protein
MKTLLTILTFVVLGLVAPSLMLAQKKNAEADLRAMIDEFRSANVKGDVATLDKHLADDYIRIRSNGTVQTKAELFDLFKTGKFKMTADDVSDLKVYTHDNTALVITTETTKGVLMGKEFAGQNRDARVFVKRGGEWKEILHTSTKIAP